MRGIAMLSVPLALWACPALAQDGPPPVATEEIRLLCEGVAAVDNDSDLFSLRTGKDEFTEAVTFILDANGEGRVKVPKRIQPAHRLDKDGWYQLIKVEKTDDEVTGQIRMNQMYKPKFRLSRISGSFTLTGTLGDFSGRCLPYNPDTVKRVF